MEERLQTKTKEVTRLMYRSVGVMKTVGGFFLSRFLCGSLVANLHEDQNRCLEVKFASRTIAFRAQADTRDFCRQFCRGVSAEISVDKFLQKSADGEMKSLGTVWSKPPAVTRTGGIGYVNVANDTAALGVAGGGGQNALQNADVLRIMNVVSIFGMHNGFARAEQVAIQFNTHQKNWYYTFCEFSLPIAGVIRLVG